MIKVSHILSDKGHDIFFVNRNTTVVEASECMCQQDIGALLVVDDEGAVVGIVTERDIVFAVHKFVDEFLDQTVQDLMSSDVISCRPDNTVAEAAVLMSKNGIRHLPVQNDEGLAGLISIRDVLEGRMIEVESENHNLREQLSNEIA